MALTTYFWDDHNGNILQELDETGDVLATFTNRPESFGDVISQRRDHQSSFYFFDGLGSTRSLENDSEVVSDTYLYSAFGTIESSTGTTPNPFRYVGSKQYRSSEDIADIHVRNRNLTPATGRWDSVDPYGFVDGPNVYSYVLNRPTTFIDPSGTSLRRPTVGMAHDFTQGPPVGFAGSFAGEIIGTVNMGRRFGKTLQVGANTTGMTIACGFPFLCIELKKQTDHLASKSYAIGKASTAEVFGGPGGLIVGFNIMFFPESCELATFYFDAGPIGMTAHPSDKDGEEIYSSDFEGLFNAHGGFGISLGVSETVVVGAPINQGPHDADSWGGWFTSLSGSYGIFGGDVFWSSQWIGGGFGAALGIHGATYNRTYFVQLGILPPMDCPTCLATRASAQAFSISLGPIGAVPFVRAGLDAQSVAE